MNRKNFYLAIIAVLIIYLVIVIAVSSNNIYTNALKVEQVVNKAEREVTLASKVVCEPILEQRKIGVGFFSANISTPEGIRFCEQIQ